MRFLLSSWLLAVLTVTSSAACGYDDQSYQGVLFACDLFHACPDGHTCIAGRCFRGSRPGDEPTGQLGVNCGGAMCPGSTVCCNDFTIPLLSCLPATSCTFGAGREVVLCDGPEDCGPGAVCCSEGLGGAECSPGAGCEGNDQLCNSNADCPLSAPLCCPSAAPTRPFQVCDNSC